MLNSLVAALDLIWGWLAASVPLLIHVRVSNGSMTLPQLGRTFFQAPRSPVHPGR